MAGHHITYSPGFPAYEEGEAFDSNAVATTVDRLADSSGAYIDPHLQDPCLAPSAPYSHCELGPPQTVQRYLDDSEKTAFFNADYPPKMHPGQASHLPPALFSPVHAPLHTRLPSPSSSHEPSSTSSIRSPYADTDSQHDNMPPTPPDTTHSVSSYAQPAVASPYDPLSQLPLLHFTNMGPSPTSAYVNPLDVQPDGQQDGAMYNNSPLDFSGLPEAFGYEPYDSMGHYGPGMPHQNQMAQVHGYGQLQEAQAPTLHGHTTYSRSHLTDAEDATSDLERPGKRSRAEESQHDSTAKRPRSGPKSGPKRGSPGHKQSAAPSPGNPKGKNKTPAVTTGSHQCVHCKHCFKDEASLETHVKKQHTRPYHCVFDFAGCTSNFATKNEWKRHVASQHLLLNYWLCQEGSCAMVSNAPGSSATAPGPRTRTRGGARNTTSITSSSAGPFFGPVLPNGTIFNRKDLYTQHLRRMHSPPEVKKQATKADGGHGLSSDWEAKLREKATKATQQRCSLPTHMRCPVPGCDGEFNAQDAWDLRMEHVGRHLERAAAGKEKKVTFGGPGDETLIQWAGSEDVAVIRRDINNQWELNEPLRPHRASSAGEMVLPSRPAFLAAPTAHSADEIAVAATLGTMDDEAPYSDEDAEGEVDDEQPGYPA